MPRGPKPGSPRRGGRKEGTPNKLTSLARDAIASAAKALGGAKRLAIWAKENPANESAFWTRVYPRLLPVQITGPNDGPVKIERIEHVIVDSPNSNRKDIPAAS